jgi:hypothetical protein
MVDVLALCSINQIAITLPSLEFSFGRGATDSARVWIRRKGAVCGSRDPFDSAPRSDVHRWRELGRRSAHDDSRSGGVPCKRSARAKSPRRSPFAFWWDYEEARRG